MFLLRPSSISAVWSVLITTTALAASVGNPKRSSSCATSSWNGFSQIKNAFIFGDSYTTTGFDTSLAQPSTNNPLGNPSYPGYTSSNGPNWVDYLTLQYNKSQFFTYDLAYGGATVDSALVAPYKSTVLSVAEQVQKEFMPVYGGKPSSVAPWKASDTFFAVFIGINDVGNSYGRGAAVTPGLNKQIFDVYRGLMETLYGAGARNFLFLNVPPVDRSPLTVQQGNAAVALEKADIENFNSDIVNLTQALKVAHSDVNVFSFDTNALFTKVLDNPKVFPQTSIYQNTTGYCDGYANGTPNPDSFVASCGIPVNQYFWLNSLHPTYPMHQLLAEQVASQLDSGPNVCS